MLTKDKILSIQSLNDRIQLYNEIEKKEKDLVSIYQLQAFDTFAWNSLNVIGRVENQSQLWRYFDTQQENRFDINFDIGLSGGLTDEEWSLYKKTSEIILATTKEIDPKNLTFAKNSLSRSFISYRFIKNNYTKETKILEIGPGSGYLGLLLIIDGFDYTSLEVSQALYIFQQNIFSKTKKNYNSYSWWEFLKEKELKNFNLIVGNHVFNEMHPNSLKFLIELLKNDKKIEFYFENLGYDLKNNPCDIFAKKGYYLNFYKELRNSDIYFGVISKNKTSISLSYNFFNTILNPKNILLFFKFLFKILLKKYNLNFLTYLQPFHGIRLNNKKYSISSEKLKIFKKDIINYYDSISKDAQISKDYIFLKKL